MKRIALVILIITVFLVIESHSKYRRKDRKRQNSPGFRRRVVNDEDWENYRPGREFNNRRRFRHLRRGFNLSLFNNRRGWHNFDISFDFDFNFGKPWYEGPNVCSHKSVIKNETSSGETEITCHHVSKSVVCDDKGSSYQCTYRLVTGGREEIVVVSRECCKGYTRKEHQHGCPTVLEMKDLITSAKDMKLSKFLEAINIAGLDKEMKSGNVTVFAPVDDAFEEMSEIMIPNTGVTFQKDTEVLMVSQPLVDTMVSDLKAMLLGHFSPVVYTSGRLTDEQLIATASPYKNKIRINFYDKDLMTANCIRVSSRDTVATNGVIHTVEKVLEPISQTLLDIVSSDPEMSYLKTAIGKSGLGKSLREDGQLTLLAPSDSAFRKLDPVLLARILEGDTDCLIKLLNNHILPNVICSSAIQGKSKSKNLMNRFVNLTKEADDKIFVNGAQAVETDVMATNGVLYVIDDVLVPDEALDVLEIANKSGASAIANLISRTGLAKILQTNENLTLFAPSDEAVANWLNVPTDSAELMRILTYHVIPTKIQTSDVYNDKQLDTLNGDKKIRINEYTTTFSFGRESWSWVQTAQCANVQTNNIQACNGVIYIIDKVLTPPAGKLLDVLASDSRFSELMQLIKIAEIGDQLEENGPFTVFAPTNDAFKLIEDEKLQKIVNNKDELKRLLFNHVHKDQLCCSGIKVMARDIGYSARRLTMLSKSSFRVETGVDKITIAKSSIQECDVTTTNGVIHILDKVLLDEDSRGYFWRRSWWRIEY